MATLAKSGTPSLAVTCQDPGPHEIHGRAAVALAAGDMVYLTATGTLDKANGTAANALALSVGMMPAAAQAGEKAVAYHGCEFQYGAGLTPGTRVFVSATAGALDDAATIGGTVAVGFVTTATNIFILSPTR